MTKANCTSSRRRMPALWKVGQKRPFDTAMADALEGMGIGLGLGLSQEMEVPVGIS